MSVTYNITAFYLAIFNLFDSIRIPFLNCTIFTFISGCTVAFLSIVVLKLIFGIGNTAVGGFSFVGFGNKRKAYEERQAKIDRFKNKD